MDRSRQIGSLETPRPPEPTRAHPVRNRRPHDKQPTLASQVIKPIEREDLSHLAPKSEASKRRRLAATLLGGLAIITSPLWAPKAAKLAENTWNSLAGGAAPAPENKNGLPEGLIYDAEKDRYIYTFVGGAGPEAAASDIVGVNPTAADPEQFEEIQDLSKKLMNELSSRGITDYTQIPEGTETAVPSQYTDRLDQLRTGE